MLYIIQSNSFQMSVNTPTATHSCNLSQWVEKIQPVDSVTVPHLLLILKGALSSLRRCCKSHRYHHYILPTDLCVTYRGRNPTLIKKVTLYDARCTNTNRCNSCTVTNKQHAGVVNFFCSPRSVKRYFLGDNGKQVNEHERVASSSSNAVFSLAMCVLSTMNGTWETRKWLPPANDSHHPMGAEYQLLRFGWYNINIDGRQIYKKQHNTFIRKKERHDPANGYSFLFEAPFASFKWRRPIVYTKIMETLCNMLRENEEHRLDHQALWHRIEMIQAPSKDMYIDVSIIQDSADYNDVYSHLQSPVPTKRNLNRCPVTSRKRKREAWVPHNFVNE
jgi:hypothetical protein